VESKSHELKKATSAVSYVELSEHNITSEHHPSIDTKIGNVPVQRIEFTIGLSFRLKDFVLKIQNGMINEIQTGTCEVDCRIILHNVLIAEMKGKPIKLPPLITVEANAVRSEDRQKP
jgi:hypothetical protein